MSHRKTCVQLLIVFATLIFTFSCSSSSPSFPSVDPEKEVNQTLSELRDKFEVTGLSGQKNVVRFWQEFSMERISLVQIEESSGRSVEVTFKKIPFKDGELSRSEEGRYQIENVALDLSEESKRSLKKIFDRIQNGGKRGFPDEPRSMVPVPDDGWMIVEANVDGKYWATGYLYSSQSRKAESVRELLKELYKLINDDFEL